jgi:hypothetical protein
MKLILSGLVAFLFFYVDALAQLPVNHFDRYSSTLSSSYSSAGTSLSVTSATGLPSCGSACNFYVDVEAESTNTEEVLHVTAISGTTLTVAGAQANTSASNHSSGATIIAPIDTSAVWNTTAGPVVSPIPGTTISFYIATTGSDSNPCTSSSTCQTLAHALSLIPTVVIQPYQINVANGTYSEGINTTGYIGYQGSGAGITIVGNTSTPADVIFSGTLSTCAQNGSLSGASFTQVACIAGPLPVTLSGIELNATARDALYCDNCNLVLSNVIFAGTTTECVDGFRGNVLLFNAVTCEGYNSAGVGAGIYMCCVSTLAQMSGTTTVTGPGGGSNTAWGINVERGSQFSIIGSSAALTITGVQVGLAATGHSSIDSLVSTGTFAINNTGGSQPSSSRGLYASNGSTIDMTGNTLSLDNFTTCVYAIGESEISQGPGNRTTTNCTSTGPTGNQNSVITLF